MKKRWISLLLIACMVLALLPTAVFAGDMHTVTINAGIGGEVSTDGEIWSGSVQIEVADGETIGDRVQYKPDKGYVFDYVIDPSSVRSIASGALHIIVVDNAGNAWTAGANDWGQLGRYVASGADWQLTTAAVGAEIVAAAGGMDHTVLLDKDGRAWTAGKNQYGQLGRTANKYIPNETFEQIEGDEIANVRFVDVAAGYYHTVLLDENGHVWTAGQGSSGQLGNGGRSDTTAFAMVTGTEIDNVRFTAIAAGSEHTVLLDANGNVWTAGSNSAGATGCGDSGSSYNTTFVKAYAVDDTHPAITAIAAGQQYTLLLDSTGAVWAAGNNFYKQFDSTSSGYWKSFSRVNTTYIPNKIGKIAAGASHSILIDEMGSVYLGGVNSKGCLGQTTSDKYLRPEGDAGNAEIVAAAGGNRSTILLDSNGQLWTAGGNDAGQLCRDTNFGGYGENAKFETVSKRADASEFGSNLTMEQLRAREITGDCAFTLRFRERPRVELEFKLKEDDTRVGTWIAGYEPPTFYYLGDTFVPPEKEKVVCPDGYSFTKWGVSQYSNSGVPYKVVYQAHYARSYQITYAGMDGATLGQNSPTELLETDKNLVIPNPTKTGYSFKGWVVNGTGEPQKDLKLNGKDFSADLTLTAHWEVTKYTITYDLDGGSTDNAGGYNVTDKITLTPPTKTGYTFTGWSGTDLVGEDNMTVTIPAGSTGDRKYTAHWEVTKYTITYDLDGGTADNPEEYTIESADITLNTPTRDGYTFTGWSGTELDGEANMTVTIPARSTGNREYTAHWKQNVKPAPDLPWWAGLLPALDDELPFTDVQDGDWFYDDVCYVYKNGLMNGTSATKFSPSASTTRGMVLTILARMEGVNTAGTPWYAAGRDWAVANGISDGTNMEAPVTREQLAAILYRYASFKGRDAATLEREPSAFADAGSVSGWALDAMRWAVGTGLISGSNGLLRPQSNASRAEVAAILARFAEYIG